MSTFKLPQMKKEEIDELIRTKKICRIAINRDEYPYLAPFRYVVKDDTLYFHFTNYGNKMELIRKEQKVCVQIDDYTSDLSSYQFVSLCGTLEKVTDPIEYATVMKIFSDIGKRDLSPNFLAAHGINPKDGWEFFTNNKGLVFLKLINEKARFGLKSPQ